MQMNSILNKTVLFVVNPNDLTENWFEIAAEKRNKKKNTLKAKKCKKA